MGTELILCLDNEGVVNGGELGSWKMNGSEFLSLSLF